MPSQPVVRHHHGTTQTKDQNGQNQTTSVTTGGTTNDLTYDANGATTTDEDGGTGPTMPGRSRHRDQLHGTLIETDGLSDALAGGSRSPPTPAAPHDDRPLLQHRRPGDRGRQGGSVVTRRSQCGVRQTRSSRSDSGHRLAGHSSTERTLRPAGRNYNVTSVTDTSGNVLERTSNPRTVSRRS